MPDKPLDLPMQVVKAFAKDLRAYHAGRDTMKRAVIAQRQLAALQKFRGPQGKQLRLGDIMALFEEMKDL
jgi:hypothetical protein